MNDLHAQLMANLTKHVFGDDEPSTLLINEGRLPANWVSRYVSLVASASNAWGEEKLWPREVVAAVHFASFYLQGRYDAWRVSGGRREETEAQLTKIRGVSEAFLLGKTTVDRES